MNKILGIAFSPRKIGNSEIAIKEIINNINQMEADTESEVINISNYNIRHCMACYMCLYEHKCVQDDNFEMLLNKIVDADLLIFAVPTYFFGPNALFKLFIDRFLLSFSRLNELYGKNIALITIAGLPKDGEGYTDLALKSAALVLGMHVVSSAVLYAALPGEVILNDNNIEILQNVAYNIVNGKRRIKKNVCNVCGNNYFEITEKGTLKCLVCKSEGNISFSNGAINIETKEKEMFFSSKENMMRHKEWLMSMKGKFIEHHKILKEIMIKYKD